jgi:hypothetical protein
LGRLRSGAGAGFVVATAGGGGEIDEAIIVVCERIGRGRGVALCCAVQGLGPVAMCLGRQLQLHAARRGAAKT